MTGFLHGLAILFVALTSPFSLFFVIYRVSCLSGETSYYQTSVVRNNLNFL